MRPLTTTTEAVDTALYVIFGISGIMLVGITVAMLWFLWRYNRKRQPQPVSQKDHNVWLEVTWTVIPTILVMVMFWYGWEGYLSLRRVPDNAMPVHASARMWSWLFTYENDKTSDKLYVPVGQPVRVELIAEDVLHSFYVPAFRVKRDCVPGMPTYAWFVADKPGSYDLFCAEYCGVGHADMITTVEALPPDRFEEWLAAKPTAADGGKNLLQKHGCLGCHSLDGSRQVGPTFQGIGGRQVTVTSDGATRTLVVDADYLTRSILEPNADLVEGFPAAMPGYAGKIADEELNAIVDYLLGLQAEPTTTAGPRAGSRPEGATPGEPEAEEAKGKEAAAPAVPAEGDAEGEAAEVAEEIQEPEPDETRENGSQTDDGKAIAEQNGCLGCHSLDGSRKVGPSFKGLSGSSRTVTRDGAEVTVTADADYLARAIREPGAEVVKGFPAAMPPYDQLDDRQIEALVTWLESLP